MKGLIIGMRMMRQSTYPVAPVSILGGASINVSNGFMGGESVVVWNVWLYRTMGVPGNDTDGAQSI
jgi:hypothetical protein